MLVHRRVTPALNSPVPIYTPKNPRQCPRPGFEPRPLDPESSALTMRSPPLPFFSFLILIIIVVFLLRKLIWYLQRFRSKLNLKPRSKKSQREWVRPGDGKLVQTKLTSPVFKLKTLTFLAKVRTLSYSTYTSLTTSYRNHSSWRLYQVYCTYRLSRNGGTRSHRLSQMTPWAI